MSKRAASRSLPRIADDVLECLHQHRLLSTPQLHELLFPGYAKPELGLRATQRVMQALESNDPPLVAHVNTRERTPTFLYYLTPAGLAATVSVPRLEDRKRPVTREAAAGALQNHTLEVNAACIQFVKAARGRGDECGPLDWRDELDHPITAAKAPKNAKDRNVVRCDAHLRYTLLGEDGDVALLGRFIELDRGTYSEEVLAAKLHRYAQMYAYVPPGADAPAWRALYPFAFPEILVVFAEGRRTRPGVEARMRKLLALVAVDELVQDAGEDFIISCVLLEDLRKHGPFSPVFVRHTRPRALVDWLGQRNARTEQDVLEGQGALL